ncbi:helix-turn-helix transcriptional regulator [Mycobacterium sp.]|uniref:helix-turn-helix domain-containing protein n=1 Tax=Mycobacterium sp. TaxID=1785 RepID=UPI002CBB912A|nr:helix-turn-helix transcriptional regulator [Mycobacterium sp.]HTY34014.1 helix-turn-helix transcriptional regulator [Mycobacterium sp.]
MVKNRLGDRLFEARDGRGWSRAEMAERLTERGFRCHATAVAKLENNERVLAAEELLAYAEVFGCSTDALMGRPASPGADRDFVLRRLQGSLDDAARTVRVALRDVADRVAEATQIDLDSADTEVIAAVRAACTTLDTDALQLAACGGAVAERRAGDHQEFRVQRIVRTARKDGGDA